MTNSFDATISQIVPPNYQQKKSQPAAVGTVTPPADFGPAIAALNEMGRAYLRKITKGRDITPYDLAQAADFERGELKHG